MINVLVAALVWATAATLLRFFLLHGWVPAVLLGALLGGATYLVASRRIGRKMEAVLRATEPLVAAGRIDEAIKRLESLRALARYQLMVGRIVDAHVGVLLYAQKRDWERARRCLERAPGRVWQARAMLAAGYYQRKQYELGAQVFEDALRRNRKVSLLWAAYAFCEHGRGNRERAIEILAAARRRLPRDEAIAGNLARLSNLKRMRMQSYGREWWALRLELPPRDDRPRTGTLPRSWRLRRT